MPFVAVGGEDGVDIQSIIPNNTQTAGGVVELRTWNGSAYTTYYYYSAAADGGVYNGDDCLGPGWGDLDQNVADVETSAGQGFWIRSNSSEVVTSSGQVPDEATVPILSGLNMVCNPRPIEVDIQNIVPTNTQTAGGVVELRVWNGSAYSTYYYYSAAADGGVYDGDDCLGPGWGDLDQNAVTVSIPSGTAVWVRSNASETLTFVNAHN